MRTLIKNFPNQLIESIKISNSYDLTVDPTVNNIVICGLGGSGIGGEIMKQWVSSNCKVPVEVCHNYKLPEYVNDKTLVIVCSYSGNTEETISAFEDALNREAFIIGVTSGGRLEKLLGESHKQCIKIPGGKPPRSALAYSLVQLAEIFEQSGCVKKSVKEQIAMAMIMIEDNQDKIEHKAESIINAAGSKKLLFYAEESFSPALLRACQQINENSKELAFFNVIPEMNHNEIVGWANDPGDIFVLFVRSIFEQEANQKRLNITEKIIKERTKSVLSIAAIGDNLIEQTLYLIHLFDWLSLIRAEKKGVDIVEVKVIDYLKSELSKS